ncbi:MAG: DegT/DnrJ/EryC1/StrS family aminotransferase [Bacteriovoracaceae bacterium]|jgi:dTDP-4-amino-4,6-dideoxygalactose transaminase|nr:DegT/DnrJ/EryC1/StrS family aminotransferase [Bacteriovoracaceae bacterium]
MTRPVPFYNFNDLHNHEFQEKVKSRFSEILEKNSFIEGPFNFSFEEKFSTLQNCKQTLLVANGTDALEISLLAHGIKHGDQVAVPGITFYATAEAVLNVGAIPVFVDILPESGLMDPKSLQNVLEKFSIKAVMPVHIYGLPAPMKEIDNLCQGKSIPVIEDAAQAQGTITYTGPVGSGPNLTTFSFYPTKNLSAFGDAGAILTSNDELAERIRAIRNHGRSPLKILGRNSRCDHLQAAVLDLKLEKTPTLNMARKKIACMYHQGFKKLNLPNVKILADDFLETSSWHLYPIQLNSVENRKKLGDHLKAYSIGFTPFYEKALHQEKVLNQFQGETTNAELFAGKTICLPMNPYLVQEDIDTVVNCVASFF